MILSIGDLSTNMDSLSYHPSTANEPAGTVTIRTRNRNQHAEHSLLPAERPRVCSEMRHRWSRNVRRSSSPRILISIFVPRLLSTVHNIYPVRTTSTFRFSLRTEERSSKTRVLRLDSSKYPFMVTISPKAASAGSSRSLKLHFPDLDIGSLAVSLMPGL